SLARAASCDGVRRGAARVHERGGRRVGRLQESAPFQCALMTRASDRLAPELRSIRAHDPRVPIIANVDAEPKRTASAAIDALIAQVSSPVRWEDVVRRLASEGVTTDVEVGPGT